MSLEASMEARLSNLPAQAQQWRPQRCTIFRVPPFVRRSNSTAYEPCMVSIGPYYHGVDGLRAMEEHKWRYLQELLSRSARTCVRVSGISLSSLIQEMRSLEAQVRSCYSEQSLLDSDNFVRMLLLDGCFILEFFFKRYTKETDALCDIGWGVTLLINDLLLLENQIPFFVIEKLYDTLTGVQGSSRESLHNLFLGVQGHARESLLNLFLEHISDKAPIARPATTENIQHLLHLYYISFVPRRSLASSALSDSSDPLAGAIPCATELCEAGVTLVLRRSARNIFDISFDRDRGIMEIPAVEIDGVKRLLLVNLITFEQSQKTQEVRVLSCYVSLMGMLVRSSQDVELLYRRGILANPLADGEETARFLRHLGDGTNTNCDRQFFAVLYEDVRRYCYSRQHRIKPLEDSMPARLNSAIQGGPRQFTICRVPYCFRERNRTAYEPSMVSIGPYFHGNPALRAMEDQKWPCLHSLLSRKHSPEVNLSTLIQEMRSLEPRARACYSEQPALGSDDFVRMLLLDSSFIIEFFIKRRRDLVPNGIFVDIPWIRHGLLDAGWGRIPIYTDVFYLLENQVPFFVLERLYSIIFGPRVTSESFIREIIGFRIGGGAEIKHLLHLQYKNIVRPPTPSREEGATQNLTTCIMIGELLQRCWKCIVPMRSPPQNVHVQERKLLEYTLPRATEMSEAGVTFKLKPRSSARDIYDVTFDRVKGIMEIPELRVHDSSWLELANLLAFEQTLGHETWILMSYVSLMIQMVRTAKDVELLRKRRILVNMLADDEEAARFFSHLGDGAMASPKVTYKKLYDDVQRYCDSRWHRFKAVLMRDYFDNPWKVISIVVAAILLALTAIQTYFTVFPR